MEDPNNRQPRASSWKRWVHIDNFSGSQHIMRKFVGSAINHAAVEKDSSEVLVDLAGFEAKGMPLLEEIVASYSNITLQAKNQKTKISFQRVIIPLLYLVTRDSFVNTLQTQFKRPIYNVLFNSEKAKKFFARMIEMIDEVIESDNFTDIHEDSEEWKPSSYYDIFQPFLVFVIQVLLQFEEAIYDENILFLYRCGMLSEIVEKINKSNDIQNFQKKEIQEKSRHIKKVIESNHRKEQEKKGESENPKERYEVNVHPALIADMHFPANKFDNDLADFSQIRILPTREEIFYKDPTFVPLNNLSNEEIHFLEPNTTDRYLDTHFRLFRHDFVAPLIFGLQQYQKKLDKNPNFFIPSGSRLTAEGGNCDIFVYSGVEVIKLEKTFQIIGFGINFNQLPHVAKKTQVDRENFWKFSRRLQVSSMVCFWVEYAPELEKSREIIFATIVTRDEKKLSQIIPEITVSLKDTGNSDDYTTLFNLINQKKAKILMITSNSGFFDAYFPVLKLLQELKKDFLPFQEYLIAFNKEETTITPPKWLEQQENSKIDFSCILKPELKKTAHIAEHFKNIYVLENFSVEHFKEATTLDPMQVEALKTIFTQTISLIQGPPGTGKSFLGIQAVRVLIENRKLFDSTILAVTYTNHALDQFLEELLSCGVKNIVRVGSRSKSEALQKCSLFNLSHRSATKAESALMRGIRESMDQCFHEIDTQIKQLSARDGNLTFKDLETIMMSTSFNIYQQFEDEIESGDFQQVGNILNYWLSPPKLKVKKTETKVKIESQNPYDILNEEDNMDLKENEKSEDVKEVEELNQKPKKLNNHFEITEKIKKYLDDDEIASQFVDLLSNLTKIIPNLDQKEFYHLFVDKILESSFNKKDVEKDVQNLLNSNLTEWLKDDRLASSEYLLSCKNCKAIFLPSDPLYYAHGKLTTDQPQVDSFECFKKASPGSNSRKFIRFLLLCNTCSTEVGTLQTKSMYDKRLFPFFNIRSVLFTHANTEEIISVEQWNILKKQSLESQENEKITDDENFKSTKSFEELVHCTNIWDLEKLSYAERRVLYRHWTTQHKELTKIELLQNIQKVFEKFAKFTEINDQAKARVLRKSHIVGATTSGLARNRELMKTLGAKIVICEEAAEVLEPHLITSLSANTEQLILIGDHFQLRPKVELYDLELVSRKGYNLDVSLFERLVMENEFPNTVLSTQRRMRPDISNLIRSTLYPDLKDGENVVSYPNVLGMQNNLWFYSHNVREDGSAGDESRSKSNKFEVEMVVGLTKYLIQQGYMPGDITILSPYVGQIINLRNALSNEVMTFIDEKDQEDIAKALEGEENEEPQDSDDITVIRQNLKNRVRISSVDNFQGEESKIVIVSLVRNNSEGKIGFLNTSNRINVLLSRAKEGMYLLGSSDFIRKNSKKSSMWIGVLNELEKQNRIQPYWPVVCQNHPDTLNKIETVKDFETKVLDGGCSLKCEKRLKCGHICSKLCHSNPCTLRCLNECMRYPPECPYQHICPKLCFENCGDCKKVVKKEFELPCGHTVSNLLCHQTLNLDLVECKEEISVTLACGHENKVKCYQSNEGLSCKVVCGQEVEECGHPCTNLCGDCKALDSAHFCNAKCKKQLFCGHECSKTCHKDSVECGPCEKKCDLKCSHSRCSHPCSALCSPCLSQCRNECPHTGKCELLCSSPCLKLPCEEKCDKKLQCGHRCPSICGEPCPSQRFCPICGQQSVKKTIVDLISLKNYEQHFRKPNAEPVIILPCNHIFRKSDLDQIFNIDVYYEKSEDNKKFIGCRMLSEVISVEGDIKVATCPQCRIPISNVSRYSRIINASKVLALQKKFINIVKAKFHTIQLQKSLIQQKKVYNSILAAFQNNPIKQLLETTGVSIKKLKKISKNNDYSHLNNELNFLKIDPTLQIEAYIGRASIVAQELSQNKPLKSADITSIKWTNISKTFSITINDLAKASDLAENSKSYLSLSKVTIATIKLELVKLEYARYCARKQHKAKGFENPKELLENIHLKFRALEEFIERHKSVKEKLKNEITSLKHQIPIDLSSDEIKVVLTAMAPELGSNQGHWYTCQNGHLYCIADCGQAMQESVCIECGSPVGGTNHRLVDSNSVVDVDDL